LLFRTPPQQIQSENVKPT